MGRFSVAGELKIEKIPAKELLKTGVDDIKDSHLWFWIRWFGSK